MSLELFYFSGGPRERVLDAVIKAGHRVMGVFVNNPERWPKIAATIALAKVHGLPVIVVGSKAHLHAVSEAVAGTVCLSAGFNYLFPHAFLQRVPICLNVHGSLLPLYPGARTLSWAIEDGRIESGVTVHAVDEGMDTGPILLQHAFPLSPFETTKSLARKTIEFEPQVVVEALKLYEENGRAVLTPQPTNRLPTPENRRPEHSQIDPSKPLADLINKIRAADPRDYPAYFFYHGEKVCISLWRKEKPSDEIDLI